MPSVKHLVVDSNAFLKNIQLQDIGENIYTVRSVIEEIRDRQTRARLEVLPYELHIIEPSETSLAIVIKYSKATGDFSVLSKTDLLVLALTVDLHLEHADTPLKSEPSSVQQVTTFEKQRNGESLQLPGFVNCDDEDESDDEKGWISVSNYKPKVEAKDDAIVGCYTTDFAMQNTLLSLGVEIIAFGGHKVKMLKTWTLRCYGCFTLTSKMDKKFCPGCGNATLKRVAVTVDDNGEKKIHLNPRVKITARGKKFPLPAPKGGKHVIQPILAEDQKITEDKSTKRNRRINDVFRDDLIEGTSPFLMKDVTSRSAFLQRGTKYWERKNPNASHK